MAVRLPRVRISLMLLKTADNDPFYTHVTASFMLEARRRHPRFPLIRVLEYGVCLHDMRADDRAYLDKIEASGRRNVHKARRLGYRFQPIAYNDWLGDIAAIRRSTTVRQGPMPESLLQDKAAPCQNPPSRCATHDYRYFGVVKDGALVAYAGVLVAGELAMIEHILGHAEHQANGVVPLLLIGMEDVIRREHPQSCYYGYGTWFGASESLRRFKKKFLFLPHRVRWIGGRKGGA